MNHEQLGDMGPPFERASPEDFIAQSEMAFLRWWEELEPAGTWEHIELDQTTARMIWLSDDLPPMEPGRRASRVRPSSPETVRASGLPRFLEWWDGLDPPSSYEGRSLNADETRVVWLAACVQMWEELESIHESAHAHVEVTSTTANLELAYIVDKQHHGKLTFSLNDLMDWSQEHEQNIRRSRNGDTMCYLDGKY